MRILLLHPYNESEAYHYAVPQIALGYLSAALKKHGHRDVVVRDAHLDRWSVEDVISQVRQAQPEVIGIRLWSHQLNTVREYVRGFKQAAPQAAIVVGGPHMTVAPDYVHRMSGVDYGIAGEAEQSLPLLVDHVAGREVDLRKIPGLVATMGGERLKNPILKDADLDSYEVDWEALDLPAYHRLSQRTPAYNHRRSLNGFLFATRGCPYPCTYCAAAIINGKQIREHSAERVMRDIEHLYRNYGVRHFNLMDDNFTFYKETVVDFCRAFLARRHEFPGVTFHNPNGVRVDRLDDEMLALMKKCGWQWLHLGLESASERVLRNMKKRLKLDIVRKNISMIRRHGIRCWGFFILGYPEETRQDMLDTINFAVESELSAATFSLFSPIPGTEVYRTLEKQGLIPADYNMTGYNSPTERVFAHGMDALDLQRMQRYGLLRFYARPDRAYYLLRHMDLRTVANRVHTIFLNGWQSSPPAPVSAPR